MHSEFVTTADGGLLRGVRESLRDAERVLICVAFAAEAGVRLIEDELKGLQKRERPVGLVATTAFGTTTPAALGLARQLGVDVRRYDPSRGTFHPKVYLGIGKRGAARAVIGSANLTGGLATNVEAGMYLKGTLRDEPLRSMWEWAEERWGDPVVELWTPPPEGALQSGDPFDEVLFELLKAEVRRDPVFQTLGRQPKRNVVRALTRAALLIETDRSRAEGGQPQPVSAWMVNVAWEFLNTHGALTNQHLLNELRVHRSSAVCALLARLPGFEPFVDAGRIGVRRVGERLTH